MSVLKNKPAVGWGIFAVLVLLAAGVLWYSTRPAPGSVDALTQTITIRDAQTGDEWTVKRGKMEYELFLASNQGPLDPKTGIVNPKTGKPNGFPTDSSWDETIRRINEQRAAAEAARKLDKH